MSDQQGPEGQQNQGQGGQEPPKLIIDSDWKSQAQSEKERLAQQEQARKAQSPGGQGAPGAGQPGQDEPPPTDFTELIRMLTTQALLYMGAIPDPSTGKAVLALDIAKYHIDLLTMLEEKTKGNLSEEEATTLSQTAHELRSEFVNMSRALAQAIQEGKIKPQQAGATGIMGGGQAGAAPGQ